MLRDRADRKSASIADTAAKPAPDAAVGDATGAASAGHRGRGLQRALWFALPVVLVLGLAIGGVGWYARRQYYVGFRGERIAVYQGVPGGVFIWQPTVAWTSRTLERGDLNPAERLRVRDQRSYATEAEARDAVLRIQDRVAADYARATTTTTTLPGASGVSGVTGATGPTN